MRKGGRRHLGCTYFHENSAVSPSLLNSIHFPNANTLPHLDFGSLPLAQCPGAENRGRREQGSPGQQPERPPALTHDAVGPVGRRRARRGAVMIRAAAVEGGHRRKTGVDVC